MPRQCAITGKKPLSGKNISHAHNVTNRWQKPNLQNKRIYLTEEKRWVRVRLSTRALRTINKKGLMRYLRDEGLTLKDVTA
ncbi:MAG: 50S ribosomal protein L28 [Acidobacteriota bacterium]